MNIKGDRKIVAKLLNVCANLKPALEFGFVFPQILFFPRHNIFKVKWDYETMKMYHLECPIMIVLQREELEQPVSEQGHDKQE